MVPSLEQLLLKHDLGQRVLGRHINQLSHGPAKGCLDMTDFFAHCLGCLWTPF